MSECKYCRVLFSFFFNAMVVIPTIDKVMLLYSEARCVPLSPNSGRVVQCVGQAKALALLKKTEEVEAAGGMMTMVSSSLSGAPS